MRRTWHKLEIQRGKLGMTWHRRVQGVVFAGTVLGALGVAAAANWVDVSLWAWFGWF